MSIESGFTPPNIDKSKQEKPSSKEVSFLNPEQKETEPTFVETYELKDKEGNIVCRVESTYLDEQSTEFSDLIQKKARRLKSIVLEKDGKRMDVMNLIGLKKQINIFVIFDLASQEQFGFNAKRGFVTVPKPDHPTSVAVMLHELGHAKQDEHPFYQSLREFIRVPKFELGSENPRAFFSRLGVLYPELLKRFPDEAVFQKLDQIRKKAIPALEEEQRLIELKRAEARGELKPFQLMRMKDDDAVSQKNKRAIVWQYQTALKELPLATLLVPEKLIERDATKRAFQWMQQITEEIKVDLASVNADEYALTSEEKGHCASSVQRSMKTMRQLGGSTTKGHLLKMLTTYDALDQIPVPSLKRLEQIEKEEEAKQKSNA